MFGLLAADLNEIRYIYIYSGALIVLLLIAFGGYSFFKRWMSQSDTPAGAGFTLSDLRKLHEQGQMSDEEYEQTRANMLASAKKMTGKLPDVLPTKSARSATAGNPRPPAQ